MPSLSFADFATYGEKGNSRQATVNVRDSRSALYGGMSDQGRALGARLTRIARSLPRDMIHSLTRHDAVHLPEECPGTSIGAIHPV